MKAFSFYFLLLLVLFSGRINGQEIVAPEPKQRRFLIVPAPFRYPETRFGILIGGIYNFRLTKDKTERPSQIQLGGGYTQNRQIISYLNTQLVTTGRKYLINTEFGYNDYFFPFGGIGFEQGKKYNENYSVRFPRLRGTVLRRISKNVYLGPKISYDNYTIYKTQPGGVLESKMISGSDGGTLVQFGIIANYDTRDNILSSYKGVLVEAAITGSSVNVAGKYNFIRYWLNANYFIPVNDRTTLALNGTSELYYGDPPFNAMAYLGGANNMRGFYDGRYRNKKALSGQAEIRWKFIDELSFAGFVSSGTVADELSGMRLDLLLITAGGGLRIFLDQKDRLNLRMDYGRTNTNTGAFYLTFKEAF